MAERRCTVPGCERPQLCEACYKRHRRRGDIDEVASTPPWPSRAGPLDCGHTGRFVSSIPTRCWDCHLLHLRSTGREERAERLAYLKAQRAEWLIDWPRLVADLLASYEARAKRLAPMPERGSRDPSDHSDR